MRIRSRGTVLLLAATGVLFAQSLPFDLDGRAVDALSSSRAKATVVVFVRTDCPISNRYAPEIQRLYARFARQGVNFWLVYPAREDTARSIQDHLADFGYRIRALHDPDHALVTLAKAHVTPEAAVFGQKRQLLYHGRIDDRYPDIGKARPAPTSHDLEIAIEAVLAGKTLPQAATRAVGCFIEDLK